MRLPRKFVTAHYNFLLREIPDGLTLEGAFISTYVGRLLMVVVIEWLRCCSVTLFRKEHFACYLVSSWTLLGHAEDRASCCLWLQRRSARTRMTLRAIKRNRSMPKALPSGQWEWPAPARGLTA